MTAEIFKPDGKNTIHDGIEHEPGGGKALLDPDGFTLVNLRRLVLFLPGKGDT